MDESVVEEIERLEAENTDRLGGLMTGRAGAPVQLPPGTFELMRIVDYLEVLLESKTTWHLDRAKLKYARHCSEMLDQLETAARQAYITQGPGGSINGNRP